MPASTMVRHSNSERNNGSLTSDDSPVNADFEISDHDLEEVLFACTAGGDVGRAARSYYNTFIDHAPENRERAIRALVRMEARQTGAA